MGGNLVMLMFFGKQLLAQSDRADVTTGSGRFAPPVAVQTRVE
jgi:hypothetical protein